MRPSRCDKLAAGVALFSLSACDPRHPSPSGRQARSSPRSGRTWASSPAPATSWAGPGSCRGGRECPPARGS